MGSGVGRQFQSSGSFVKRDVKYSVGITLSQLMEDAGIGKFLGPNLDLEDASLETFQFVPVFPE